MTKNEIQDRLKIWKARPLSWSQLSSFEYDPEQWRRRYILNEDQRETEEMAFGKLIGERMANDRKFLPEVMRHDVSEHPFKVMFGKIPLTGFGDFFCSITRKKLQELKTGVRPWTQKRADDHGQITMYNLMHFITEKVKPEEMDNELIWLPTERVEDGDFKVTIKLKEPVVPKIFKTKRTMADILAFGSRINRVYGEMERYALKHS